MLTYQLKREANVQGQSRSGLVRHPAVARVTCIDRLVN